MSNNGLQLSDVQDFIEQNELEDQTVSSGGNFERKLMKPGKHKFRMVSYIEIGVHDQPEYKGATKDPAEEVFITFEFYNKDDITENEDGTKRAVRKTVRLKKSFHEKSTYRKLFEAMREGDTTITHMSQMLGVKGWLMNVTWSQNKQVLKGKKAIEEAEKLREQNKDDKNFRIWDNLKGDNGYMVSPAVVDVEDEEGEMVTKPVTVPPHIGPLAMFVWDKPVPAHWASIHIEGTYTRTIDGKETEVSKNRFQEACIAANNYEGSPLQGMLDGLEDLPTSEKSGDEVPAKDKTAQKEKAKPDAKKEEAPAEEPTPDPEPADEPEEDENVDDEMAELGL